MVDQNFGSALQLCNTPAFTSGLRGKLREGLLSRDQFTGPQQLGGVHLIVLDQQGAGFANPLFDDPLSQWESPRISAARVFHTAASP